jgi:hypothetical protein
MIKLIRIIMKKIKNYTEFVNEARKFDSPKEEALKVGCCHCDGHNFIEEKDKAICKDCGCIHTDDYYEYRRTVGEDKKKLSGPTTWLPDKDKFDLEKEPERERELATA